MGSLLQRSSYWAVHPGCRSPALLAHRSVSTFIVFPPGPLYPPWTPVLFCHFPANTADTKSLCLAHFSEELVVVEGNYGTKQEIMSNLMRNLTAIPHLGKFLTPWVLDFPQPSSCFFLLSIAPWGKQTFFPPYQAVELDFTFCIFPLCLQPEATHLAKPKRLIKVISLNRNTLSWVML